MAAAFPYLVAISGPATIDSEGEFVAITRRQRRHTFEQHRRWSMVKAEARKQRWVLVAGNACVLIPAVLVLALIPAPPVWNGLIAGVLSAIAFWMAYGVLLIRTYPVTMGEWGEYFTREFLDWGRRRGWRVIHDIPMERRNIDHLAITPAAVLAIETKFIGAGRDWTSDQWKARHLQDARTSARSTRSLVRSQQLHHEIPVVPVLILWGAGSPKLEQPELVDDVYVVYGPNAKPWAAHWANGPITPDLARTVERGLLDYQARRDRHTPAS
jgi:hypothetical protein